MKDIEIRGLSKSFGQKIAVDNISLDVEQGELLGLLGVNGAGKTTTIRLLSCLSRPSGGDALICGHSIVHDEQDVKSMISISPQETSVAPNLTVRENLQLIASIYGRTRAQAERVIERFSLGQIADTRAKKLSGGWQRRLSIAMAMVSEPRVLFLDEPTLGLDVLARRELWNHIVALKGHITMVLTTHYLEEVEALCDRVAVMANGHILAAGTVAELTAATGTQNLEDAFISISEGREVKL